MKDGRLVNKGGYRESHPCSWRHLLKSNDSSNGFHMEWEESALKIIVLVKTVALEQRSQLGDAAGPFTFSNSGKMQILKSLPVTNVLVNEGSPASHVCLEGCSLDMGAVQFPCSCCSSANWSCGSRTFLCLCFICAGGFRTLALRMPPAGNDFRLWSAWVNLELVTKR